MTTTWTRLLRRPFFWILFYFLIRLYGINNPPLEITHSWRQVTGLMVAQNFLLEDPNLLYPRVDLEGGEDRIIGMEFPLLNYLHYGVALLFGYEHWYGRLINLLVSSLGIFFYSKLLREEFGEKISSYATLALLASIFFSFSRKMMPDTFSVSIAMIALYYGRQYFLKGKGLHLLLFGLLAALGMLSKLPALLVLSPLTLLLFSREVKVQRKWSFGLTAFLVVLPVYYWYYVWNPHLSETYGSWYNSGMDLREGSREIFDNLGNVWKNFSFHAYYGYVFFLLTIMGFLLLLRRDNQKLKWITMVYTVLMFLYIFKAGYYFHHHSYYMIPIVPLMALLLAYGLDQLAKQRWAIFLLLIGCVESFANQQHDLRIKESELYKLESKALVGEQLKAGAKIVVLSDGNPQLLYLSGREGWIRKAEELENKRKMKELKKKGAKAILIDKQEGDLRLNYPLLKEDEHYLLYAL